MTSPKDAGKAAELRDKTARLARSGRADADAEPIMSPTSDANPPQECPGSKARAGT